MRLLVVVDQEATLDTDRLRQLTKEDITINMPNKEGIAVYTCGKVVPWDYDWTAFVQIGQCEAERKLEPSTVIPVTSDYLGELVNLVETMQSSEAEGETPFAEV